MGLIEAMEASDVCWCCGEETKPFNSAYGLVSYHCEGCDVKWQWIKYLSTDAEPVTIATEEVA